jgi:glycosyltransferase involved in cell wall biosynthesis
LEGVELLGQIPHRDVWRLMKAARVLVVPSLWHEGFSLVAIEALACGLPVVASRLQPLSEIVEDGRTGLLYDVGDPEALAARVSQAWSDTKEMATLGEEARSDFLSKYTAEVNYPRLLRVYEEARRLGGGPSR